MNASDGGHEIVYGSILEKTVLVERACEIELTLKENCQLSHGSIHATTILVDKSCAIELTLTESTASVTSDDFSLTLDQECDSGGSRSNIRDEKSRTKRHDRYLQRPMLPIFRCMQVVVDEAGAAAGWLCQSRSLTDEECYTSFNSESRDGLRDLFDSSQSFDSSSDEKPTKHGVATIQAIADFTKIFGTSGSFAARRNELWDTCDPRATHSRLLAKRQSFRTNIAITARSRRRSPRSQAIVVSNSRAAYIQQLKRSRQRYNDFVHRTLLPRLSRMAKEYLQDNPAQTIPIRPVLPRRRIERLSAPPGCALPGTSKPRPPIQCKVISLSGGGFGACYTTTTKMATSVLRESLNAVVELTNISKMNIVIPMMMMMRAMSKIRTISMICFSESHNSNVATTDLDNTISPDDPADPVEAITYSVDRYFQARPEGKQNIESSIITAYYRDAKVWGDDELNEIMCFSTKQVFQSLSDLPSFSDPSMTKSWDAASDDGMDKEMNALGMITEQLRRELEDAVTAPLFCAEPPFPLRTNGEPPRTECAATYDDISDYCRFEMEELRSSAMECWDGLHRGTISEHLRSELEDAGITPLSCGEPTFSGSTDEDTPTTDLATTWDEIANYCRFEMEELKSAAMECWNGLHQWTSHKL